jgi:hypothetical protein
MKTNRQKPMWAQMGHRRPISRRELLAAGAIPFSASLLAPDWFNLLLPQAHANTVCPSAGSGLIPMITVNLAGGAAMAANFVPMDAGGQPLPSYSVMGLGNGSLPLENEFGTVKFAGADANGNLISKFLQGLREMAPTAIPKTAFIGVCVRSRDDSAENRFAIDGLVSKAGLAGRLLPNLGRQMTFTGISQKPAVVSSSLPLVVNSFSAITGSLGYAAALGTSINTEQKVALAKMISRLSENQSRRIARDSTGTEVKKLVDCANIKNVELANLSSAGVDPRTDTKGAELSSTWGINGGTGNGDQRLIFAAMTYNVLKGNAGSAGLEIGGYDYHNNTRTTGDQKDLEAGQTVGRILESAALMGKKAFIYVTSDGAVSSADSASRNSPWTSDRGIAGASYILYYDPAGRRPTSQNQIGYFTSGQAADDQFLTGGTPELAAIAVFANYLELNGKMNLYANIVGRTLAESELAKVLRF